MNSNRHIGIRHRVKMTKEGEARPTQVTIIGTDGAVTSYEVTSEDFELDFVRGRYPTSWRDTTSEDDLALLPPHHIEWKRVAENDLSKYPAHLVKKEGRNHFRAVKVPASYDGLKQGDRVALSLGGSGNNLAYALTNRGGKIEATVHRMPGFNLKKHREARGTENKDDDSLILAEALRDSPGDFHLMRPQDQDMIRLIEFFRLRTDVMRARIAAYQRQATRLIGAVFLSPEGNYPEGTIRDSFNAETRDELDFALAEEKAAEKDLKTACSGLAVYNALFDPVEGMGPLIAARILAAIIDIRRFPTAAKFRAFMGVHVLEDGTFVRRRSGQVANWHPDARQALYLFVADQCNKRPNTAWGQKLRWMKKRLRNKYPTEVVIIGTDGKQKRRYTDGHIHKMAIWKTASCFATWLFKQWWNLENGKPIHLTPPYPPGEGPIPASPTTSDETTEAGTEPLAQAA